MLVVESVEVFDSDILLAKCPDGGEALEGGGDVGVHWTPSYKERKDYKS